MIEPAFPKIRMSQKSLFSYEAGFVRSLLQKRPETRGTYARALRGFTRWFKLDRGFRFQVKDVERYKRYLTTRKKLSKVSVSTYLTAVRRFCQYLVDRGAIRSNPARFVGGNERPSTHSRKVLSTDDVRNLFAVIEPGGDLGVRDYAMAKLMLGCGLSEIEIVRANVGDRINGNGETMLSVQGKGRDRKDEKVLLSENVKQALDRYLATRTVKSGDEPLFLSAGNRTHGMRMSTRGVRDRINFYLQKAGVKRGRVRKVTPYSLRHTAAMMMADAGATPDEIRQRMRLGSVATAMMYVDKAKRQVTARKHRK
jgi:integrase/recombinase XerC/integrase/recombinase XerD